MVNEKRDFSKYDNPKSENFGISRQLLNWYRRNKGLNTYEEVAEYQNEKHYFSNKYEHKATSRQWSKLTIEKNPALYEKNLEYKLLHGITYTGIISYKFRHKLGTIQEALEHRQNNTRRLNKGFNACDEYNADYSKLQSKIANLERLITDDSIRLPKIKELKDEYISIYGKLPI